MHSKHWFEYVKSCYDLVLESESGQRITETIIKLGQSLKLTIIAEGVETEAQAVVLRALGCHEAQGYLYSKPLTYDDLCKFLTTTT